MIVCAALALVGFASARAAAEEHPRLHEALYEMRHARTQLKEAKHDFGGHRADALKALDGAITQIEEALKAVGDNAKGTEPAKDSYKDYANFPHIRHALAEAKLARTELKDAAHDYKGHRAKAVEALDEVVTQLDKAIKYAK
jgi:L-lactate utilization protein LutB